MMTGFQSVPNVCDVQATRTCPSCGADALCDAWHCLGCGRPFFAPPVTVPAPESRDKHFYVSAVGNRRVRSMTVLSMLTGAGPG